jgi:RNA polymerase sigma-70 factor (ECF subfamily)
MEPSVGDADANLMAAPSLSDPDGAEQLVERYGDRLYRLALRITGVQADAEWALEDALRMAARTVNSFTNESALRSWIYRTVADAAHQRRKRRQHVDTAPLDDVVPLLNADGHFGPMDDWSTRIDEPALQGGLRSILVEAIDALPPDYGTALILHDVEGVSRQEIAEILDIEVPAVNSRVHRARLFVRERLSRYFESGKSGPRIGVNPSPGAEHPIG